MSTELYLIRHGHAQRLPSGDYASARLTELGRAQANRTGEYFSEQSIRFDGFYSSPLPRAWETALLIGARIGQRPIARAGLQEMEYRELPAAVVLELLARTGLFDRYFESVVGKPIRWPLIGRVASVVLDLLKQHPHGRIALVVHGGVISGILAWYFPRERQKWWRTTVGNCSITRLRVTGEQAQLIVLDQVQHLARHLPTSGDASPRRPYSLG